MCKWPTLCFLYWLASANASPGLTQLGWLGVGDPIPHYDARSLSLGSYGLVSPTVETLSLSFGTSSVAEEISNNAGVDQRRISYAHPPSLQVLLPLPGGFSCRLRTRELWNYNYDGESPIYDSLRQDLVVGVESVSSRGCLYGLTMGIRRRAWGLLSFECALLLSLGQEQVEQATSFQDPALWGEYSQEKEKYCGFGVEIGGAARLGEHTELAVSRLGTQEVGNVRYPSLISLELWHRVGIRRAPSILLSLQRADWRRAQGGASNTLAVSLGSEFWVTDRTPFRVSLSSEPWCGGEGVERVSLGLGTGLRVSKVWFDLGMRTGARSFEVDGERVSELLVTTLVTGSYWL